METIKVLGDLLAGGFGMENEFCFLKGIVECSSGVIQNCNNMRTQKCPLEDVQRFCYLKGMVTCSEGRVQDCNNRRVTSCPEKK